jgi:uracil-DNA glycosylase
MMQTKLRLCPWGSVTLGADLPPCPECACQWHDQILSEMPLVELTLLAESFTQNYYLGKRAAKTMTGTIRGWKNFGPGIVPIL